MVDFNQDIPIGCDHAGYEMKKYLVEKLTPEGYHFKDYGTFSNESVDYPDFIHPLAKAVNDGIYQKGIVLCGSGIGVSIVANKYPQVRAALCWKEEIARLSRQHNDANVIALPSRFMTCEEAVKIVRTFLSAGFEGGRHERRVLKIAAMLK
jgi:ribose 5-phosphate isomerase B